MDFIYKNVDRYSIKLCEDYGFSICVSGDGMIDIGIYPPNGSVQGYMPVGRLLIPDIPAGRGWKFYASRPFVFRPPVRYGDVIGGDLREVLDNVIVQMVMEG